MRPDLHFAMRRTIEHGPAFCPKDLFAGPAPRILLGLKAHANTISHARHVAMEETYPRTRLDLGAERFHELATRHLADPQVRRRPLGDVGLNFPWLLDGAARDLARLEWAWLEAHGAPDCEPFDLSAVASLEPEIVARTQVARHPAARILLIGHPLRFDGRKVSEPAVLITRPRNEVLVTGVGLDLVRLTESLNGAQSLGTLLEADPQATTELVANGALVLSRGARK